MTSGTTPNETPRPQWPALSPGGIVLTGLWFGLAVGVIEVGLLAIRHRSAPILELGRDYLWMTPLAIAVTTVLASLACAGLALLGPSRIATAAAIFAGTLLAALELVLYIPRLHHFAALALATGIAVQATRWLLPRVAPFAAITRRTTPWLAALVGALGGGRRVLTLIHERRAIAALPDAPRGAPNVILVTLDAVRAPSLSLYGYSRPTTPNLDRFAARGVTFDQALSAASWTLPSHAAILTGRWHHELSTDYDRPLDGTYPTLAEFLASKGYATAGAIANLRYCGYETGLDRGFARYRDYPVSWGQLFMSSIVTRTVLNNFRLRRLIENDQHLSRKPAEQVSAEALAWIERAKGQGRPFFLFLNYFDAHEPYLPPSPYDRKFGSGRKHGRMSPLHRWLWEPAVNHSNMGEAETAEEIDAYDGAIAHLDQVVGGLLDRLTETGVLANTLVIVTADHGEEFAEHRVYEHGYSLYRAGVHVPLVIVQPKAVPAGRRVARPVSLRDLPATVADLAGLTGGQPFPGSSLSRTWGADSANPADQPILSQVNRVTGHPDWFPVSRGDLESVTFKGLRYIRNSGGGEELFHFATDPDEKTDLATRPEYADSLAELRAVVQSMVSPSVRSPR